MDVGEGFIVRDQIEWLHTRGTARYDVRRVMRELPTPNPFYAAGYLYAQGCAINVREDREEWNHRQAAGHAIRWKEMYTTERMDQLRDRRPELVKTVDHTN